MIVWGEGGGAAYEPGSDSWRPVSASCAAPMQDGHSAIWTGDRMIIWGGTQLPHPGYAYEPATDRWYVLPTTSIEPRALNLYSRRFGHTAIWSGSEMIVWGGVLKQYDLRPEEQPGWRYSVN